MTKLDADCAQLSIPHNATSGDCAYGAWFEKLKILNKMTRIGRLFRIYSERIIRPPIVAIEKGMKRVSWRLCKAPRNFNNIPY